MALSDPIIISICTPARRIGRGFWDLIDDLDERLREFDSVRIARDRHSHEAPISGDVLTPSSIGQQLQSVVRDYVYAGAVTKDEANEIAGFVVDYVDELRHALKLHGLDR